MRQRFDRARDQLHRWLPGPVRRLVPATFVGYLLINALTFSVDLGLMSLGFRALQLPYPVAVSIGYFVALTLSYCLNRTLNFHDHGAVGWELVRYVLLVAVNYGALVVGLSTVLHHLGVQFQVARVLAACAEAVFMYCGMRWVVFRGTDALGRPAEPEPTSPRADKGS